MNLKERILGVIYGNACGDAIGLLTEFMTPEQTIEYYGDKENLEFVDKVPGLHRDGWRTGDWTDDTDQMILIILSILEQEGKVSAVNYAYKLKQWCMKGFPELGDFAGMGLGATTNEVICNSEFLTNPHTVSNYVWERSGRFVAPNGALMRTSILGVYQYQSLEQVQENTLQICKVTHADPRCQASTVALTTAIALMLQRHDDVINKDGSFNVDAIIKKAYNAAAKLLPDDKSREELKNYMFTTEISSLKLDEARKIGYTYKCLGAGFWAFKQNDFRIALQKICMEGGDADTNGAVAGALLGCKLGVRNIPPSWLNNLKHKEWLDGILARFFPLIDDRFGTVKDNDNCPMEM